MLTSQDEQFKEWRNHSATVLKCPASRVHLQCPITALKYPTNSSWKLLVSKTTIRAHPTISSTIYGTLKPSDRIGWKGCWQAFLRTKTSVTLGTGDELLWMNCAAVVKVQAGFQTGQIVTFGGLWKDVWQRRPSSPVETASIVWDTGQGCQNHNAVLHWFQQVIHGNSRW